MSLIETFEAKANCAACQRLQSVREGQGKPHSRWVCHTTKLVGMKDVPLAHPGPTVQVTTVLGYVSSQTAKDADGKEFVCSFLPHDGREVELRADRAPGRRSERGRRGGNGRNNGGWS